MFTALKHWFFPRESNNHRAKLLHHSSLFIAILILFSFGVIITPLRHTYPQILGIQNSITVDELVRLTNEERAKQNLPPLRLAPELSSAATQKAGDMFTKNYWAHFAPDGSTPWGFIKNAGYEYIYAGENLARGFVNPSDIVSAWMASPSHRENLLSGSYTDVGFAISDGNLGGEETVLVVQMLGSRQNTVATAPSPAISPVPTQAVSEVAKGPEVQQIVAAVETKPLVNTRSVGKQVSIMIIFLFILLFIFDIIIIERKQIVRILSHNINQIFYLLFVLGMIFIVTRGSIL